MIAQMTRYNFVMYHGDCGAFLEELRELGLVDVTLRDFEPSAEQVEQLGRLERLEKAVQVLHSVKVVEGGCGGQQEVEQAVEMTEMAADKLQSNLSEIIKLKAVVERTRIWGDFNPVVIEELKQKGLNVRLFEVSSKRFNPQWHTNYNVEVIAQRGGMHYFAVVEYDQTAVLEGVVEFAVPEVPATTLLQKITELEAQNAKLQGELERAACAQSAIKSEIEELKNAINFSNAESSATDEIDGSVKIIEGFSDTLDQKTVEEFAERFDVVMFSNAAKTEENPPIKLKNNFFARLYEPIGAIYMFPRYNELDLTPFFAPFFMIFFGMCFGDAGYGLLLMLAIVLLWRKIPVQFRGVAWLGLFLNFSAVVFGILSGNVFGIELMKIPALVEFKEYFLTPNDIFYISLALGGVQVCFGLILRTFNRIKRGGGFIHGVSNIGWLILIFSSIVAFSEVAGEHFSTSSVGYKICLYTGVALILFFTVPHKPIASIGKGLYSFYETATGIVGDLISYVRLFAIGLAGAVIAQVFNELSVGLSGDIPVVSIIVMILILAIGHGLNIFISFLGAVVHPIRLTFVEFFKNAEFEGGGREFSPFKKNKN